jgi:hypothetical protein
MDDAPVCLGQRWSNATWATRYTSPTQKGSATGNDADWDAARAAYFEAWSRETKAEREHALADTFLKLGQVLHLVQDLAVPAHVRNDFMAHLQGCTINGVAINQWCGNNFERFVKLSPGLVDRMSGAPIGFAASLAAYWDHDCYDGTNPGGGWTCGLAEYTNANFVSQYTIFTEDQLPVQPHAFPYPRESSTDLGELLAGRLVAQRMVAEDGITDLNLYLRKNTDGESIFPFVKVGYVTDRLWTVLSLRRHLRLAFQLDDAVYAAHAEKLLPQAISYSAGLLDYFFRGSLDFEVKVPGGEEEKFEWVVTNMTSDEMDGAFHLYAEDDDENRGSSPEASISSARLAPGGATETIVFTPSRKARKYVVVFQGRLGLEDRAVVGKVKRFTPPPALPVQRGTVHTDEPTVERETSDTGWARCASMGRVHKPAQRARGYFYPWYLTKYLQRVALMQKAPEPGASPAILKLNGIDVGSAWSRETGPNIDPQTWEIEIRDFPKPNYIVAEAQDGMRVLTPLVWAGMGTSKTASVNFPRCPEGLIETRYITTDINVNIYFGDGFELNDGESYPVSNPHTAVGFIPFTGIDESPVGSFQDTFRDLFQGYPEVLPPPSCAMGPWGPATRVENFAVENPGNHGVYWRKNRAFVREMEGENVALVEGGSVPSIPEAPPLPIVQFKRDYLWMEQVVFEELGIKPPEPGVITLE